MEVIKFKEQKDGSAILTPECSLEEESILLKAGIDELIKEKDLKVICTTKKLKSKKNVKQIDLTEEETSYLMSIAVNAILREKIKEEEQKYELESTIQ